MPATACLPLRRRARDAAVEPTTAVHGRGETAGRSHVGDLDASTTKMGGSKWQASVTVTIHDGSERNIAGATVTGTWSGAKTGTLSGTTGADGTVTLNTGKLSGGTKVTFTVGGVTHATLGYDAAANHNPDGDIDSDGTSITARKP